MLLLVRPTLDLGCVQSFFTSSLMATHRVEGCQPSDVQLRMASGNFDLGNTKKMPAGIPCSGEHASQFSQLTKGCDDAPKPTCSKVDDWH